MHQEHADNLVKSTSTNFKTGQRHKEVVPCNNTCDLIGVVKQNLVKLNSEKDKPQLKPTDIADGYENYINASFINVLSNQTYNFNRVY